MRYDINKDCYIMEIKVEDENYDVDLTKEELEKAFTTFGDFQQLIADKVNEVHKRHFARKLIRDLSEYAQHIYG